MENSWIEILSNLNNSLAINGTQNIFFAVYGWKIPAGMVRYKKYMFKCAFTFTDCTCPFNKLQSIFKMLIVVVVSKTALQCGKIIRK